VQHRNIVSLHL